MSLSAAVLAAEGPNSDGDIGNFSNRAEIDANTQPGWTTGPNTIFDRGGVPRLSTVAPLGIGPLDPPLVLPPNIAVSPLVLNFGTVEILTTTTQTVTITNTGGSSLSVTGLIMSGSVDFTLGAAAPFAVAPAASVNVPVNYRPSAAGAASSSLRVDSNDPRQPQITVALSGTGMPPPPAPVCNITINPPTLNFGALNVGASSTLPVVVGNTGTANCNVILALAGSADFALAAGVSTSLSVAPSTSVSVGVLYTPTAPGADAGTLDVHSNDPSRPDVIVPLQGSGQPLPANIQVTPLALDFGTVNVGTTAGSIVTIRNTGGVTLSITGLSIAGSFDFTLGAAAPTTPFAVAPAASVNVPVSYTPSAAGAASGSLRVDSNDPRQPQVMVALSGTGMLPPPAPVCNITVNPPTLNFGAINVGASSTLPVVVGNTGTTNCNVILALAGSADFALAAGVLTSFSVAPSTTVSVGVLYTPTAPGADAGTLDVRSNDATRPTVSVPLQGSGQSLPANIQVSPLALDFGTVNVGTTASSIVTIRNTGGVTLNVTGLNIAGSLDFTLGAAAPPIPFSVAPAASVNVPVSYRPSAAGAASGSLRVDSDDARQPQVTVALSGTGAAVPPPPVVCTITVNPALLSFGAHDVGTTSALRVTVGNTGTANCPVVLVLGGSPAFALAAGVPSAFTVAPSTTVPVDVTFRPTAPGGASGTLDVRSNDATRPTVSVPLSGSGVSPPPGGVTALRIKEAEWSAWESKLEVEGEVQPGGVDVTVIDAGSGMTLGVVRADGLGVWELQVRLDPGSAPCSVQATAGGLQSAVMAVAYTPARCNPVVFCTITVNPALLSFAAHDVGTTSTLRVTVGNSGTGNCKVMLALGGSPAFALAAGVPSAFTVAPSTTVPVDVTFRPTAPGGASGTLGVMSDDATRPTVSVPLSGSGVSPPPAVTAIRVGRAEWDGDHSELEVEGVVQPGGVDVAIIDADSSMRLGVVRAYGSGYWELQVTLNPASAPCRVQATAGGIRSAVMAVAGAPARCP